MAALEERLFFYRDLMTKLAEAARDEDAEKIESYTDLEKLEGGKIQALEKSLRSFPLGSGDAEACSLLEPRIEKAAREAREASEAAKKVLLDRMESLKRRAASAKRSSPGKGSSPLPPPPSFIDISL